MSSKKILAGPRKLTGDSRNYSTQFAPSERGLCAKWSLVGGHKQLSQNSNDQPKKWPRLFTKGGQLQKVPNIVIILRTLLYF